MWNQWSLAGRSWDHLGSMVERGRINLYVPEVVVQEVARGRRHDANDLVDELHRVKLSRIELLLQLGLPTRRVDLLIRVQQLVARYDTELRARLDQLCAAIIPIPSTSHEVVLARAMEGRQPFDSGGRNGYRDVLIWHSLLEVAELDHAAIVFVTNNTRDFCTGKPPALLKFLASEVAEVSPRATVLIATSVAEIGARVEEVERDLGLEYPVFFRPTDEVIRAALLRCTDVIVAGASPPTPGRWGNEIEGGWPGASILEEDPIDVASIDFQFESLDCVPDGDGWEQFVATVQAEVTLDGFAFKADAYGEDQVTFDVQDSDWNDHYMHVWEYHDMTLTFRLTLDKDGTVIDECWLEAAASDSE